MNPISTNIIDNDSHEEAALERQRKMARADCQALYNFTVDAAPLEMAAQALDKSASIRAKLSSARARAPAHSTLMSPIDKSIAVVRRVIAAGLKTREASHAKFCAALERERKRVFRRDFVASRCFVKTRGVCLLCDKSGHVSLFPCCSRGDNKPAVCRPCLEQSAFHSSHFGTEAAARCPFCNNEYNVYVDGNENRNV